MKFIITESEISNAIEHYFNKLIKSDEYHWVDYIEAYVGTTEDVGWRAADIYPYYLFTIHFKNGHKPEYESQNRLYERLSDFISFLNSENNPVYFSTKSVLFDGETKSFPYWFN